MSAKFRFPLQVWHPVRDFGLSIFFLCQTYGGGTLRFCVGICRWIVIKANVLLSSFVKWYNEGNLEMKPDLKINFIPFLQAKKWPKLFSEIVFYASFLLQHPPIPRLWTIQETGPCVWSSDIEDRKPSWLAILDHQLHSEPCCGHTSFYCPAVSKEE